MIKVISLFIFITGLTLFCLFLGKEFKEIFFLNNVLKNIIGKNKIETKEDVVLLKNHLNKIKYTPKLRTVKRPLLRHTASYILKNNYGFCGENARVAIKLFLLSGIKAARIYLYGTKWGHVVLEQKNNGEWFLFDGHYDPKTALKPKQVMFIQSEDLKSYPNDYLENEYVDFARLKLFHKINSFKKFSKIRLPSTLIYIFESPFLIKASFFLVISLIGLIIYYYTL